MKPIVSTPNRTEQVYAAIRDSICEGSLAPSTHLVQEDLAARLGVSRQPVQQAMILLKNDGLVVESARRGLYVAPLDAEATINRYQIRIALDQLAARLVAERAAGSQGFAARLRREGDEILDAGVRALNQERFYEAVGHDLEFHWFIYEMSGNPLIGITAEPHWHYLRRVMNAVLRQARRGPVVWDEHLQILDLLVEGDIEGSLFMVEMHARGAQDAFIAVLPGTDRATGQMEPASESA